MRELGLIVDAGYEALPRHDDALVRAFADELDAVMRLHLEGDAAAVDRGAFGVDRHGLAGHGRRDVRNIDMNAETALAALDMRLEHLEARPLHEADHEAGGEHRRHELKVMRFR